ncbi:MAG: PEP-CTERM sorting domain-containing protein [Phycisphaerae bacterium]
MIRKALLLAIVFGAASAGRAVTIQFDYRYDTEGFYSTSDRRAALEYAAGRFAQYIDDLSAIEPSGANTWEAQFTNPASGLSTSVSNLVVPADTLVLFIGARDLGGSTLGRAGPGGFSASGFSDWLDTVDTRGQTGENATPASDFGPWGGSMALNSTTNWHFGIANGPAPGQADFVSVVQHELGHLLGVGTSNSWKAHVKTDADGDYYFDGPASVLEHGQTIDLQPGGAHWAEDTISRIGNSFQEAAMDPNITIGERKRFTELDLAGLVDIGWEQTVRGDANADGFVSAADVELLGANYGREGATWEDGDFDGDGDVDLIDFSWLVTNYPLSEGESAESLLSQTNVPEPTTPALLGLGGLALLKRRR